MDEYFQKYILEFPACRNNKEYFMTALKAAIPILTSAADSQSDIIQKSSQYSIKSRKRGNASFTAGQLAKSVQEYTGSILHAPDLSQELALAYANRSAALFELKKYEDSLKDIGRALELDYPADLKTKLFKRKGRCLGSLGKPGARSSFQKALLWLNKTNLSHDKKMQHERELNILISRPCHTVKLDENVVHHSLPEIGTLSPEVPCASDAVAIRYSKKFGRHLVATRKVKPGQILILEKAYCSKLDNENILTHCSYCLQQSCNLLPCESCVHVTYCSESCKDQAWDEYHEIECPVIGQLLKFSDMEGVLVGLRMAITATQKGTKLNALKQELEEVDHNTDPRTRGFGDDGKFHSNRYRSVYSLSDNTDKRPREQLTYGAQQVAITVSTLARNSKIFGKKLDLRTLLTNPDVIFLGELILRNLWICNTNIHGLAEYSGQIRNYGTGLMPVSSLLNHSCDSNTLRICYKDSQVLYAAYPIEQGEQIFSSYGPSFIHMVKSERHKTLEARHFHCECIPCREDWPLGEKVPSYAKQPISQTAKNELAILLRNLKIMCQGFTKGNTKEQMLDLMNELLKTIATLFELAQKPCKELLLAVGLVQQLHAAGDALFDFISTSPEYDTKLRFLLFCMNLDNLIQSY